MSEFHNKTHEAFLNLLQKQLTTSYQEMSENCENFNLSKNLLSLKNAAAATDENMSKMYEVMLRCNPDDIEMLIASYSEYLVDMSITEKNCSYFAYSKFRFDEIYANMEEFLTQK